MMIRSKNDDISEIKILKSYIIYQSGRLFAGTLREDLIINLDVCYQVGC